MPPQDNLLLENELPVPDAEVAEAKRRLGSMVEADYTRVREDLHRAQGLIAAYELQLTGEREEASAARVMLERTMSDLTQLHATIAELRRERHFLASEVMRAGELEVRLTEMADERDALRRELEQVRAEMDALRAAKSPSEAQ